MRPSLLRPFIPLTVALLILASCGDAGGDSSGTTLAQSTSATQPTTTINATTTTMPTTTTTAPTTTTIDPARLPDPAAMEQLVRDYCSAWPDVSDYLAEDVELADVPDAGWVPAGIPGEAGFVKETDEAIVRGRSHVGAALKATEFTTIDCGDPAVVSADWIALPVSASREDGSGEEGIWVLRIVDDQIRWLLAYGSEVDVVLAASTKPNPVIAAEARAFCAFFEGYGYRRDPRAVIDAMSDDPAVHVIPGNLHYIGASGVTVDVSFYFPQDLVTCGDITTNGRWSAQASTLAEPSIDLALFGFTVQQHVDGLIHRQYNQYTQTSGEGNWGLHLDDE